jgi:hypothetical protein
MNVNRHSNAGHKARRLGLRVGTLAAVALMAVGATVSVDTGSASAYTQTPIAGSAAAARAPETLHPTAYTFLETDTWSMWDSTGGRVWSGGKVDWFYDGFLYPVYRGQYRDARVTLAVTGCLWVKVSWKTLTGTASWPPSGSVNRVSDGYYRACGPRGTTVWLNGVAYASRTVQSTTVCIGYSDYASYTLRRFDACKQMWKY